MAAASTAGSMQREIDALKQALRERDEEVSQCHKRIRALTSSALPRQMVASGYKVLDLVLTHSIVPYPRDTRPVVEGLRGLELQSCRTLCNVRATCTRAMKVNNSDKQVDLYLKECKFRYLARETHRLVWHNRAFVWDHCDWGPFTRESVQPVRALGESWATLNSLDDGLRGLDEAIAMADAADAE